MELGVTNEELHTFEDYMEKAANKCAYFNTFGYFEVYLYQNLFNIRILFLIIIGLRPSGVLSFLLRLSKIGEHGALGTVVGY